MYRDHTKEVQIVEMLRSEEVIRIRIQSMTNTKTEDVEATVAQILALEKAGCEITLRSRIWMQRKQLVRSRADSYSTCGRYSF